MYSKTITEEQVKVETLNKTLLMNAIWEHNKTQHVESSIYMLVSHHYIETKQTETAVELYIVPLNDREMQQALIIYHVKN